LYIITATISVYVCIDANVFSLKCIQSFVERRLQDDQRQRCIWVCVQLYIISLTLREEQSERIINRDTVYIV